MDWMYKKIGRFKLYGFFVVIFALNFYAVVGEGTAIDLTDVAEASSSVAVSNGRVNFFSEPKNILANLGDTVELPCLAFNEKGHRLQTTWIFNGEPAKLNVARNGSAIIKNVNSNNEGTYRCVVLVTYGYGGILLSTSANLTIARIKNFLVEPQDVVVVASNGGVARFECVVDAVPPATYNWYHNDILLKQNVKRLINVNSGIIQIFDVSRSDLGNYRCVASNGVGNLTSRYASLTTSNKPLTPLDSSLKVLKAPQNVSTTKGNTALFECLFSGVPTPEVVWKRTDGLMPPTARQIGSNLEISSIEPWFDGSYECTGRIAPDKEIQLKTNLSVDFPPQIREFPQELIKRQGETARFTCNTASNPIPEILWYKNGEPVVPQGRIKMFPTVGMPPDRLVKPSGEIEYKRDLVISSAGEFDAAVYQCFASNYLGEVGAAAVLVFKKEDILDPPENLQATASQSEKTVELTWDMPASLIDKKVTVFIVHFHGNGIGDVENTYGVEPNVCVNGKCRTSCCGVTTPLKPYTNYTFWVSFLLDSKSLPNTIVDSPTSFTLPSNATIVTTWDEVTTAPAPLMVNEVAENGAVRLVWDELSPHLQHGIALEYRIEYRQAETLTTSVMHVPFGIKEKTLRGLKLNAVYYFRVIPKTRAGYPEPANLLSNEFYWLKMKIRETSSTSLVAPLLNMYANNSTSIFVEFKNLRASNNTGVDVYRVILNKINVEADDLTIINTTLTKTAVIGSLEPTTTYQVFIQAVDENGTGLISSRVVRTLKHEGGPRPPVKPFVQYPKNIVCNADAGEGNRIRLTWKQPGQYVATKFIVRYSLTADNDELVNASSIRYKESTTESTTFIDDLLPGRSYLMAIQTETNVGSSKFSDDITCVVPTTVPAAPKGVSSVVLSNSSVLVTWMLGVSTDDVTFFRVRSKLNTASDNNWLETIVNGTNYQVILTDLVPSEIYFVTVSAENEAGRGPMSHTIPIVIPYTSTTTRIIVVERTSYTEGIVIGVCIAVVCVFVVLVFRARRNNRGWSWHICDFSSSTNGGVSNGLKQPNGHLPNGHCLPDCQNVNVEMLTLLPPLIENYSSDTKGGNHVPSSRYVNGFAQHVAVNGFRKPLLMQTDPLTVTVESPMNDVEQTAEQSSDLSQSAATNGSSLQSWSGDCNGVDAVGMASTSSNCTTAANRRSQNGSSSMPNINLTDSGIGFDDICNGHCLNSNHVQNYTTSSRTPVHYYHKNNINNNNYHHSTMNGENSPSPPPPKMTTTRTNGLCYPNKSGNWPKELTSNNHHKPTTRASTDVNGTGSSTDMITNHIDSHSRTISQGTC